MVGDPGLAPGLCLFPKQVGRCLPMSPLEFWCPVRESHPRRLDVSEASCCWKNRAAGVDSVGFEPTRSAF